MNRQYELDLQISLPQNAKYNANRVRHQFENHCLLFWRNPAGGPPCAKMEEKQNFMQSLKGAIAFQQRARYGIETGEGYSVQELFHSLNLARNSVIDYFRKRKNLDVTIDMNLFEGGGVVKNPSGETSSVASRFDEIFSGADSPGKARFAETSGGRPRNPVFPGSKSVSAPLSAPDIAMERTWETIFADPAEKETESPSGKDEKKAALFQMFD